MAKSKARRNVILVLLLFILTGGTILVLRTFVGRPVIAPESAETLRIRLSPTENAAFVILDAARNLPPVISNAVPATDFVKGPKAALLDAYLKEDAPEIAAAIEASRPCVEAALKAAQMAHVMPPTDWKKAKQMGFLISLRLTDALLSRAFLVAVEDALSGADIQKCVDAFVGFYRLYWCCIDDLALKSRLISNIPPRSALLRQCPVEFLRQLLPALLELRLQWQPPRFVFDEQLRRFEAHRSGWFRLMRRADMPVTSLAMEMFESAKARPVLARNYDELRRVSTGGIREYMLWRNSNPERARAAEFPLWGLGLRDICWTTTCYLTDLEGACAVLALELFKADNGEYPESLQALAPKYIPKTPTDPVTDAPLIYRREGNEYRLYSVSREGKDDGGQRYHSGDTLIYLPPEPE